MAIKTLELLEEHNLRKTEMRMQVLEVFLRTGSNALSSKDIEERLPQPDRITLYRTLKAFEEKGLIHQAIDSSGKTKYAYCASACTEHAHHDNHAHFHCQNCDTTICLDSEIKTQVKVPGGFQVDKVYLVLEGICDHCAKT